MSEILFDAALVASQQVADTVKSFHQQHEKIVSEIDQREKELKRHYAEPLPESDLVNFFAEYIDTMAEKGEKAFATNLNSISYPARAGTLEPYGRRSPLSFSEIDEIVNGHMPDTFFKGLPLPLPFFSAVGDAENGRAVLIFLLKDKIKDGLNKVMAGDLLKYSYPEKCGLPLAARRDRIAILNDDLVSLRAEKANIEGLIVKLKKGIA